MMQFYLHSCHFNCGNALPNTYVLNQKENIWFSLTNKIYILKDILFYQIEVYICERHCSFIEINTSVLQTLYELGARKFGILSVPPIGCCPAVSFANGGNCVTPLNDFAIAFYSATEALLQKLSLELKEMQYSLGNSFVMTETLLADPLAFGKHHTIVYILIICNIFKLRRHDFIFNSNQWY